MKISLRRYLRPLHRWVGLSIGLIIMWMAVTGASMVFRKQLEGPLDRDLLSVPACSQRVALDVLAANAAAVHPDGKLDYVRILSGEAGAVRTPATLVRFTDQLFVYLNPCTGDVLGSRDRYHGLFGIIEQLHRFRFMKNGSLITGTSALLFAIILVIGGCILWWPGTLRGARRALTLQAPRAGGAARFLDLHKTIGPYAALIVLTCALTGLPQSFNWYRNAVYAIASSPPPQHPPPSHIVSAGTSRLPMEDIWRKVQALAPNPRDALLHVPQRPQDAVDIYTIDQDAPHVNARTLITLDAYTGETLSFTPYAASSSGHKLYFWMLSLHTGYVGGWVGQLLLLFGVLCIPVLGYTGIRSYFRRRNLDQTRDLAVARRSVRVVKKSLEAENIYTFELADQNGVLLPPFGAGAHIDVHIRDGLVRQYSLCNDPRESHRYLIGVLRVPDSRGGSQTMHEEVEEGDLIEISGPKNHFPLVHSARRSLLLAAGIGVTPILCMAERLANVGADFDMHYWARSRPRAAFFERIGRSAFSQRVSFHFSDGAPEQRGDIPALLQSPDPGVHVYVCGPVRFMDAVLDTAKTSGWPDANVHREYFTAEVHSKADDSEFSVKIASSGKCYRVDKNESVLDVLEKHGVVIPRSCEQGVCGTCVTGVLVGIPDHRDRILTTEDRARNDRFTPCCSRAVSPELVLDL